MNETTTTTAVPPTESERRLLRPADDRVVAGVCAGLARYFGLDPLVYRIAFAALVLLGGSGLFLYGAAWLVIPDEGRGESLVEEAIRRHRDRPWLVAGVGLVAFGVLFGLTESHLWPDAGGLWIAALAIGLGIVWWQLRDRPRTDAAGAERRRSRRSGRPAPSRPPARPAAGGRRRAVRAEAASDPDLPAHDRRLLAAAGRARHPRAHGRRRRRLGSRAGGGRRPRRRRRRRRLVLRRHRRARRDRDAARRCHGAGRRSGHPAARADRRSQLPARRGDRARAVLRARDRRRCRSISATCSCRRARPASRRPSASAS